MVNIFLKNHDLLKNYSLYLTKSFYLLTISEDFYFIFHEKEEKMKLVDELPQF